jgi:sugar lactone lactonase YvrE
MGRLVGLLVIAAGLLLGAAGQVWAAPGDVYLGDSNNGQIFRVPAGTNVAGLISSDADFSAPSALEFAPDGRLLVVDYDAFAGNGGLLVLNPGSGEATPFAGGSPFQQPDGMALSYEGGVYVTDITAPSIFRVDRITGAITPVTSGGDFASGSLGIAVEPSTGRIFATDGATNHVFTVDPRTGGQSTFSTTPDSSDQLAGLTRLPNGTLGAVDQNNGNLYRVDGSGAATQIAQDPDFTNGGYGMTHDLDGNFIVADGNAPFSFTRVDPQTGAKNAVAPRPAGAYLEGAGVEPPLCNGKLASIPGTTRSETINGSPLDDVIAGLAGDDLINSLGGIGLVCAGDGNDTVTGGDLADTLLGEAGND